MDTSVNLNQKLANNAQAQTETAGTIANANGAPSPLFNVSTSTETAGTVASNSTGPAGGGFSANA